MSIVNAAGKSIASTHLSNGTIITMFNQIINVTTQISFKNANGVVKYRMTADIGAQADKLRCAQYIVSMSQAALSQTPRMVLYISSKTVINSATDITVLPLYEFISPTITRLGFENYQLTWWCNSDESVNTSLYDDIKIKKFSQHQLDSFTPPATATQILCSANLRWELLSQDGGGIKDSFPVLTPIIHNPVILSTKTGYGYVTDFASNSGGGGGGNGMSLHSHTSVTDGGFAAAVFMPSAVMRPFNWR